MTFSRKIKAAGIATIAMLGLSACQASAGIGIHEDGRATIAIEFHDSYGILAQEKISSCEDLLSASLEQLKNDPQIAEIPSGTIDLLLEQVTITELESDDELACRADFETPDSIVDGEIVKETADTFIVDGRIDDSEDLPAGLGFLINMLDVRLVVATPGPIIQAEGAKIVGNRAVYDSLPYLIEHGVYVEGLKHGTDDFSDLFMPAGSAGLPLWAWVAIGFGIAGLIGFFVFFTMQKKEPVSSPAELSTYGYEVNLASASTPDQAATQQPATAQPSTTQPTEEFSNEDLI